MGEITKLKDQNFTNNAKTTSEPSTVADSTVNTDDEGSEQHKAMQRLMSVHKTWGIHQNAF